MRGDPLAPSSSGSMFRRASVSHTMPMTSGPASEPIQGTAITPYQAYGIPRAALSYSPRSASPRSPVRGGDAPLYHPIPNPGTTRSPTIGYRPPPSPPSGSGGAARAKPSGPPPPPPAPTSSNGADAFRYSPRNALSRSLNTVCPLAPRRQAISLADLTAPYNTEPKPLAAPPMERADDSAVGASSPPTSIAVIRQRAPG